MPEKPRDYYEEDKVSASPDRTPEKTEQHEAMDSFLAKLREMTAELQRKARAERPRRPRE